MAAYCLAANRLAPLSAPEPLKCTAPQIPDYHRLCELAKRLPTLDPEAVLATAMLHAVGVELAAALQASLAEYGISEGRLRVLTKLMVLARPATHSELAECSGVTKGTITGLVDGLEHDGFVRREPNPDDRRVMMIELTRAGQGCLDQILPGHLSRLSRLMGQLSKQEQKTLVDLLLKVRAGLPALRD